MKPFIGIAANIMSSGQAGMGWVEADIVPEYVNIPKDYSDAVLKAGGLPYVLPYSHDSEVQMEMLSGIDGLILVGGIDIDPRHYGEDYHANIGSTNTEMDSFHLSLIRTALEQDLPILGICRGHQLLNVAAGGTLYQDIASQVDQALTHRLQGITSKWHPVHAVSLTPGSRLAGIFAQESIWTNSYHHQAVKDLAGLYTVTGLTKDGVIEAIESKEHRFVVGVQWHPEMMLERHPEVLPLFQALIDVAGE